MSQSNPYSAPVDAAEAPLPTDEAELLLHAQPNAALRAATGTLVATTVVMAVLALRLVLHVAPNAAALALVGSHLALGVATAVAAWASRAGKLWGGLLGLVSSIPVAALSLFALLTLSIGGLFGILLAIANGVLLAMSLSTVRRIGRARAAFARALET